MKKSEFESVLNEEIVRAEKALISSITVPKEKSAAGMGDLLAQITIQSIRQSVATTLRILENMGILTFDS